MKHKLYQCIGVTLSLLCIAIICFRSVLAEGLLAMNVGDWITIGGIVIGLIGVILGVTIPLRRDGKTIDETKSIAADIQPTINNIDYRTKKHTEKIDFIATEMEIFKRMKSEAGGNGIQPEVLIASMSSVFEENAQLRKQYQNAKLQIRKLSLENKQLKDALQRTRPNYSNDLPEFEFEP